MNEVVWNENTLKEVKSFPDDVKKALGYLIYKLQRGDKLSAPHSKSMPSLDKGCHELRMREKDGIYRVFYYLKIEGRIFIFHAFQKKTQKTPQKEISLGKKNLKEMLYDNQI